MGNARRSVDATRDHLDRLVRKRNTLNTAIGDSYEALLIAVARIDHTPEQSVDLYQWAGQLTAGHRGMTPRSPVSRMADHLGHSLKDLQAWVRDTRNLPGAGSYAEGAFPVLTRVWLPRNGVACVYALLADGVVVYVGQSRNIKRRLRTHWRERAKPGIDSWRVYQCVTTDAAIDLEGELIADLSPRHNRIGNRFPHTS